MRILYAASEANPFAKSGGLADVAGALPKALVKDGVDARVIMPLYGDLKFRDKLEYVTNYSVPVGWRTSDNLSSNFSSSGRLRFVPVIFSLYI